MSKKISKNSVAMIRFTPQQYHLIRVAVANYEDDQGRHVSLPEFIRKATLGVTKVVLEQQELYEKTINDWNSRQVGRELMEQATSNKEKADGVAVGEMIIGETDIP